MRSNVTTPRIPFQQQQQQATTTNIRIYVNYKKLSLPKKVVLIAVKTRMRTHSDTKHLKYCVDANESCMSKNMSKEYAPVKKRAKWIQNVGKSFYTRLFIAETAHSD